MKKLISILVVAALIAVCLVANVFAANEPQIIVSSAEALRGDEVVLTVSLVNNPGITNGKITVNYNDNDLELVKLNTATMDNFLNGIQAMSYGASMNFVSTVDVTADVVLFEIHLKVKDTAVGGDYAIGLSVELMKNNAEEDVIFEVVEGTVSVHVCDPVPVAGSPATIPSTGVKAHGKCACGKLYIDGVEVTEEDLIIPMLGQMIVSNGNGLPGEEIKLTVSLVNNPGITNGKITVTCDTEGLEFVKIDTATYDNFVYGINALSNGNAMNFVAVSDVTADFELFHIYVKLKDGAVGEFEVNVNIELMKNNAGEDVGFATFAGVVSAHVCEAGEPVIENVVDATCTTEGSYDEVVYCSGCGKELSRQQVVVEPTGHEMGQWYVYTASTAKVKGELHSDCAHCDHYESQQLPYLGDVNGDDKVDTTDAKLIMQFDLTMIDSIGLNLLVADVNGDGEVDTTDAKLIMQFDLGMVNDLPNSN